MIKTEKGLTFISTIILVIIIIAIVCLAVFFTKGEVTKEKAEDIKTDMLRVEAKIQKISGIYTLEKKEELLIGTKLSDVQEEQPIKEFLEKELFSPEEKNKKYYVLNQENLNELELGNVVLEENSYYIVEYTSSQVYYTKGYYDENGDIHYQSKEVKEEIESKSNTENKVESQQEEQKAENKDNEEK